MTSSLYVKFYDTKFLFGFVHQYSFNTFYNFSVCNMEDAQQVYFY